MADAAAPRAPGKKKGLLPWILAGVVSLILAGDLGYRVFSYFRARSESTAASKAAGQKTAAAAPKDKKREAKSTVVLEPFLVNLADRDAVRFVKAAFQFGMVAEDGSEQFTSNKAVVAATRDCVISLLSGMTSDQILTPEGKTRLRDEIKKTVNGLSEVKVADVYIVEFVVQL